MSHIADRNGRAKRQALIRAGQLVWTLWGYFPPDEVEAADAVDRGERDARRARWRAVVERLRDELGCDPTPEEVDAEIERLEADEAARAASLRCREVFYDFSGDHGDQATHAPSTPRWTGRAPRSRRASGATKTVGTGDGPPPPEPPSGLRPLLVTDRTASGLLGLSGRQFRLFLQENEVPHAKVGRRLVARVDRVLEVIDRLSAAEPRPAWSEDAAVAAACKGGSR
jgi:hypothetical protein